MIVKKKDTETTAQYEQTRSGYAICVIGVGAIVGLAVASLFIPVGVGVSAATAGILLTGTFIGGALTASCFNPVYGSDFKNSGIQSPDPTDPIIFDLNKDGVLETTDINNGVYFDHENDGFAETSAWVGNNDGILFFDTNNNGEIDNGTELLTADNISEYDSNNDGIIDEHDTNFANLKILKGDGTLLTLEEAGIQAINLSTTQINDIDENGNEQVYEATYTRTDGTTGKYGEFLVNTDTSNSIATEWLDETDEIKKLPDISGRGTVYSLHQAMLRDLSL